MPELLTILGVILHLAILHPVPALIFILWIWGLLSRGSRKRSRQEQMPSQPAVSPVLPLSVQQPTPALQSLGGPPPGRLTEAVAAPPSPATTPLSFAEQTLARVKREFISKPGPIQAPAAPSTQSSAAIQQLRVESDRQAQAVLNANAAAQAVTVAAAAVDAAKPRAGFVELLGQGDPNRGALLAAVVLSQAFERRKPHR